MANRFANGAYVIDLSTSTATAGACNVANPEGVAIFVTGAFFDIASASTISGTGNFNIGAASSSGVSASLFDAAPTTVAGVFSNYSSGQAGTSGVPAALWSSGNYLVGTWATAGPSTAFNGNLVVQYLIRST